MIRTHNQIPYLYCLNIVTVVNVVVCGYFLHLLLLQHGDIESNPGPRNEQTNKNLSCYHCNTNSLLAHNLAKTSKIKAYNSIFNHDFICILETYFDSSVSEGDRSFQLNGYILLKADHPSNTKQGGVYICYKESLCVCEVKLPNLSQCIICVSLRNCIGYIGPVLSTDLQVKTMPNLKIFCQIL